MGLRGEFGDGDGRCVGGEDDIFGQDSVERMEDLGLDLEALRRGLDSEIGFGQPLAVDCGGDAGQNQIDLGLGQLAFGGFAGQVCGDLADGAVEEALVNVT